MTLIDTIAAIGQVNATAVPTAYTPAPALEPIQHATFGQLLARGVEHVESRIDHANAMVRAFALDDSVPLHEVTIALEEARIAVELAMQVRGRIVEGYREIMNMQL